MYSPLYLPLYSSLSPNPMLILEEGEYKIRPYGKVSAPKPFLLDERLPIVAKDNAVYQCAISEQPAAAS